MKRTNNNERGIALFMSIFTLLLLTAIAASLILVATTETTINSNYRYEEISFFAARSGVAEASDRLMSTTASTPVIVPPSGAPSASGGVVYIINQGKLAKTVQPWVASTNSSPNIYMDDELCHDGYTIAGMSSGTPDVVCTTLPSGSSWYTTVTSNAPWNGTSAALPYQWARVAWKLNGSISHLTQGSTTVSDYYVNSSLPAADIVCWNGVSEIAVSGTSCPAGDTNVYLITSLAVAPNGARTMVQSEVTVNAVPGMAFGLFANSTACPSITFSGNGTTDSYSTAGHSSMTQANAQSVFNSTQQQTGGNIGTNGSVSLTGNATIGGNIGAANANTGNCPAGLKTTGNSGMAKNQTPANVLQAVPMTVFPAPPAPNPLPPTTSKGYSGNTTTNLTPGSYGNLTFSGNAVINLAAGTYNINSISTSGNAQINISGAVVINLAGTGQSTVLSITGNGFSNSTYVPSNLLINYAGTGTIQIAGNGNMYGVVDAPNSSLTYSGNAGFYGAMIGNTIVDSGNGSVNYDRSLSVATIQSNGSYSTLAFRALPY